MEYNVNNFIGVFDGVFEKEYCDDLINKFEFLSTMNKTQHRIEHGYDPLDADNHVYFISDDLQGDTQTMMSNFRFLKTFNIKMWECYNLYIKKYGIMKNLARHQLKNVVMSGMKTITYKHLHMQRCLKNAQVNQSTRLLFWLLLRMV